MPHEWLTAYGGIALVVLGGIYLVYALLRRDKTVWVYKRQAGTEASVEPRESPQTPSEQQSGGFSGPSGSRRRGEALLVAALLQSRIALRDGRVPLAYPTGGERPKGSGAATSRTSLSSRSSVRRGTSTTSIATASSSTTTASTASIGKPATSSSRT